MTIPQRRQQFFGQKPARQKNGVEMHPAGFVEFHLDAVGRINGVNFALMLDAMTQLKKHFAQPVAAVFKGGFFIGIVFRVEREGEEQFAADSRRLLPANSPSLLRNTLKPLAMPSKNALCSGTGRLSK